MTTPGWYARGPRGPGITSGEGAPSGTPDGGSGDLYLDTETGDLYEYTTSWAVVGNLTGPAGASITSGEGAPTGATVQGALYLNVSNADVYEYDSGWSVVGNIRGIQGPQGEGIHIDASVATYADLPLDAGDAGYSVLVDADGRLYIWDGAAFPADGEGALVRGDSAYEVAVGNGFAGTESEWLDSLVGEQGEPGGQYYQAAVGDGSSASIPVVHGLSTLAVTVGVWDTATGERVDCDVFRTDINTVTLEFDPDSPPDTGEVTVVVSAAGAPVAYSPTDVDAAGAVMNSDTTTADMAFVIDEDDMVSDSSTKLPTQQSVKAFVLAKIAELIDSAPGALDTLNELAAALGDDPEFATTVTNALATKQPLDATLTALAALSTANNKLVYADGADSFALTDLTAAARGLLDDADASAMRTTLGVVIGTHVQAWDADLDTWATKTPPSGAVVGTSDTQTLSGKTLTNPTVNNYTEGVVAIGAVTTTHTLDLTNGTIQTATLTASTGCTFTMPTATAGKSFTLLLKQAASTGNGTATFTGVKWPTGGAPTITATAGKMDILTFFCDGTNWYGSATQGFTP